MKAFAKNIKAEGIISRVDMHLVEYMEISVPEFPLPPLCWLVFGSHINCSDFNKNKEDWRSEQNPFALSL